MKCSKTLSNLSPGKKTLFALDVYNFRYTSFYRERNPHIRTVYAFLQYFKTKVFIPISRLTLLACCIRPCFPACYRRRPPPAAQRCRRPLYRWSTRWTRSSHSECGGPWTFTGGKLSFTGPFFCSEKVKFLGSFVKVCLFAVSLID